MHARAGMTDFELAFIPWFWFDEGAIDYTAPVTDKLALSAEDEDYMDLWGLELRHMQFRQNKILEFGGGEAGEIRFMQEYPATPEEAFSSNVEGGYIEARHVIRARRKAREYAVGFGPRIWGIDPSYTGEDRFVTVERKGRQCVRLARWQRLRTTQSVGRISNMIDEAIRENRKPDIICVDVGGVGAGVFDQLVEICDKLKILLVPVLGGEQADDPDRWPNKRRENWGRMKEWFEDPVCPSIPDDDEFQADITTPLMDWDSKGRHIVETKKQIVKTRKLPSPDHGDALAITFALTVGPGWSYESQDDLEHARRSINWRAH
jgi:hypothetical protein